MEDTQRNYRKKSSAWNAFVDESDGSDPSDCKLILPIQVIFLRLVVTLCEARGNLPARRAYHAASSLHKICRCWLGDETIRHRRARSTSLEKGFRATETRTMQHLDPHNQALFFEINQMRTAQMRTLSPARHRSHIQSP